MKLAQTDEKYRKVNEQIHFAGQYYATRQIQKDFLNTRFKKRFRAEHSAELDQYNEAVAYFLGNCGGSIPSMKQLKAEKADLKGLQDEQRKEFAGLCGHDPSFWSFCRSWKAKESARAVIFVPAYT